MLKPSAARKSVSKTCSRGHHFTKSSSCPVCPQCWSGYYKKQLQGDFPEKIGAPTLRALHSHKVKTLAQLAKYTEAETLSWHGVGPKAITILRQALHASGRKWKV